MLYDIGYDNDAPILNQRSTVDLNATVFTAQLTATGIKLAGEIVSLSAATRPVRPPR